MAEEHSANAAAAETEPLQEEPVDDGSMSLTKHLEELRTRIIRSLQAIAVGSAISYFYIEQIIEYLTKPAGKLYYMQPAEAFFTYLKVAILSGFLLALPVVFYHVWRFFLPALTRKERAVLAILVPISVLLFFLGLAFSFYLVLPIGIKFFIGFTTDNLQALFSIEKYLCPALRLCLRAAADHYDSGQDGHRDIGVSEKVSGDRDFFHICHRSCRDPAGCHFAVHARRADDRAL